MSTPHPCDGYRALLSEMLAGAVSAGELDAAEEHLQDCRHCRETLQAWATQERTIFELEAAGHALSLRERLLDRLYSPSGRTGAFDAVPVAAPGERAAAPRPAGERLRTREGFAVPVAAAERAARPWPTGARLPTQEGVAVPAARPSPRAPLRTAAADSRHQSRGSFWAALAVTAFLTLVISYYFYRHAQATAAAGAALTAVTGNVTMVYQTRELKASAGSTVRPGSELRVGPAGTAAVRYADGTTVDLGAGSRATFGTTTGGGKEVRLALGVLAATVAPQPPGRPLTVVTPHAAAEAGGAQCRLAVASTETLLRVQTGQLVVRHSGRGLDLNAGEAAVAAATGLTRLTAADAWLREVLVRATVAPWEAADFGQGSMRDDQATWLVENRQGGERRLWYQRGSSSPILFDAARWKRGVFIAQAMLPPDTGEAPPEFVPPPAAQRVQCAVAGARDAATPRLPGGGGLGLVFYGGNRLAPGPLRYGAKSAPLLDDQVPQLRPGIWYSCVVYFDQTARGHGLAVAAAWPATGAPVPAVAAWRRIVDAAADGKAVGLGFTAQGVRVLLRGPKLVPFGPELPPPPPELAGN